MKSPILGLAIAALLTVPVAAHAKHCSITIRDHGADTPAHWVDRSAPDDARIGITTTDGSADFLILDHGLSVQMSDRCLREMRREIRKKEHDDDDNPIGAAIKSAVMNTVVNMLDHGLEVRLRDIRSVDYRDGRLVVIANDGDRVFEGIEIGGEKMLASFEPEDARAFVAEFRRAKHRR